MSEPSTAREALIVEALGQVDGLLKRVEAVVPALDKSRQALTEAGGVLSRQLEALEGQMAAITQTARTQVVQHVVERIDEAAKRAREVQSRVMADAARALFERELERALQRMAVQAQATIRAKPVWVPWLTHATAAAVAAAAAGTLAVWLCGR